MVNENKRYFKAKLGNKTFGRYSGKYPSQAANKALTIIYKNENKV